jgi:hypothetical protein
MKPAIKIRLIVSIIVIVLIVAITAIFLARAPVPVPGSFPNDFAESDRRQIASIVHADGSNRSLAALKRGQLSFAWDLLRIAKKQRVWTVRHQRDGQSVWVHVGYEDKSQSDGYLLTARYIISKKGDRWLIQGSDI